MLIDAPRVYMIIRFLTSLANSTMFTTYAIFYIAELGFHPLQLLLIGMVLEGTVLIFEGITGVVADTYSRRVSVLCGMIVLGIGFVLQGATPGPEAVLPLVTAFAWILAGQVVCGIGYTLISGADQAWIVDEVGADNLGNLFMRAQQVSLFATLLGIGLSVLLSTLATHLPYVVGGLLYIGLGLFLLLFMKETRFVRPKPNRRGYWSEMGKTWLEGIRAIRTKPALLLILLVTVCIGAASEGYDRLWEAHMIMEIGFPQAGGLSMQMWFGLIAALSALLGIVAVKWADNRLDLRKERVVVRSMFVLTALHISAVVSFALSPSFAWALVFVLVIDVIRSLVQPVYDTWLNRNLDSNVRATVISMMSQTDALGQTAGGPFVGWVGNRVSIRASLLVAAALLSPILFVCTRFRKTASEHSADNR
ncbi:MFS transporter [Brevibacillus sp. TJ4]|uniref:MFS transporter n=1 Tax=Brevibacillus sp. TJ4 TaxID=3234853 RepID=UPI0037D26B04